MEDLPDAGSPAVNSVDEPQGNADPGDMLGPDIEEEHSPNAEIGNPTGDPDAEDSDNPGDQPEPDDDPALRAAGLDDEDDDADDDDVRGDDDSELDELDEAQFDNFDPEAANIVVPVAIDETNVGQLGVHKRKRTEEEERERKKKKKEGRRVRESKRPKKRGGDDDDDPDGQIMEGTRSRGGRSSKPVRREATPEDEEAMAPEQRRRKALERKMDEALRTNKPARRKAGGIDLQDLGEEELQRMRNEMATAAQRDQDARKLGQPASHKLKILPAVVELLNRNTLRSAILDPDINVLEAVRFFLEPADEDAALPNYQIQREMFAMLSKLQMTKEALIASGIGKVVMYYTKSNQPQPAIKRQAEKLIQGWMSVVLNKKRSGKSQNVEIRTFDPVAASQRALTSASQQDRSALLEEKRRRALQAPVPGNRARVEGGLSTYTIAPQNTLSNSGLHAQRMGGGGDETFKKLAARAQAKASKR